jgi:hypothetical protein
MPAEQEVPPYPHCANAGFPTPQLLKISDPYQDGDFSSCLQVPNKDVQSALAGGVAGTTWQKVIIIGVQALQLC